MSIIDWLTYPYRVWDRWYWSCVDRARHKLSEDCRRYGGRAVWPQDDR